MQAWVHLINHSQDSSVHVIKKGINKQESQLFQITTDFSL